MSKDRWFRIVSAVLFVTVAFVLLAGKLVANSYLNWTSVASWALVVLAGLAGIEFLPLNDSLDHGVHRFSTLVGFVALFFWLGIGDPTLATMMLTIVLLAGLVLNTRSIVRQRWSANRKGSSEPSAMKARLGVVTIIVVVTIASLFYRWLVLHRLEQTSALFIGIPALLAILMTLFSRPKSATGVLCLVMAIALLVSGIFLGEGFICILMASPIFFLIAILVGSAADSARKRKPSSQRLMGCLMLLVFVPMSFEGTRANLSFPREEAVTREVILAVPAPEIEKRLAATPTFATDLPTFLRLGFPRPTETFGSGNRIGDIRRIHFAGGEGKPGDLTLEVAAADEHSLEFKALSDTSHIAHWLRWQTTRLEWNSLPDGRTRVTCTARYRRLLDPAWYFKPWERYAVGLSTDYLLRSLTGGPAK